MRVLHINVNYITSALHQTMIEHLDRCGVESKVFVPTYDKNRAVIDVNENVIVSECFKKWDRLLYFHKQRKIISSIEQSYDISQFEIIHAYTLFTDGNVAMQLWKKYGVPYVVAVRNTDVNDFFKKMIHLRSHGVEILRNAKAVFFLSPAYRDTVLNTYVPKKFLTEIRKKSYIIPNGIDAFWHQNKQFKDYRASQERFDRKIITLAYVGNIDKNKNVGLTLRALEKLQSEGWKTTMIAVGRIVDREVYNQLSASKIFTYLPPKEKEQLIALYQAADVFCMPSHKETFGLVYAEAMSQGVPVIYTRGQGFDRQFQDGVVGYSVYSRDTEELCQNIYKIIQDYCCISKNCVENIDRFNWNNISREYQRIYAKISQRQK